MCLVLWPVPGAITCKKFSHSKALKPVNSKGNQPWIFIGMTGVEALILWPPDVKSWLIGKDPDAEKDRKQEEKQTTEDKIVGWHHQLNGQEFEQASADGEGQGSLASYSPRGWRNQTWLSNRTRQRFQACLLLSLLACRLLEGVPVACFPWNICVSANPTLHPTVCTCRSVTCT